MRTRNNIKKNKNKTKQKKKKKVRDHCHFTGEYRGAAHKSCKLKFKIKPGKTNIPIVFHNLKVYDSHLIMQKVHKAKGNITCIPNNAKKYISFSIGQLKFLDSFQFMASSLEKLVEGVIGAIPIKQLEMMKIQLLMNIGYSQHNVKSVML